jgi:hypothetical protein
MIDWSGLAANSLWILGCALALATFSYASWQASMNSSKLSALLRQTPMQAGFNLAGSMFSAGLALTSGPGWKMILWAALGVIFLVQLILNARALHILE